MKTPLIDLPAVDCASVKRHRLTQLTNKGEVVELTRKEFGLVKFFLDKPNRALRHNQIMKSVWSNRIIVTPYSVDRCVTTLRAKVESDTVNPKYIQTIRDIGYRFCLLDSEHR